MVKVNNHIKDGGIDQESVNKAYQENKQILAEKADKKANMKPNKIKKVLLYAGIFGLGVFALHKCKRDDKVVIDNTPAITDEKEANETNKPAIDKTAIKSEAVDELEAAIVAEEEITNAYSKMSYTDFVAKSALAYQKAKEVDDKFLPSYINSIHFIVALPNLTDETIDQLMEQGLVSSDYNIIADDARNGISATINGILTGNVIDLSDLAPNDLTNEQVSAMVADAATLNNNPSEDKVSEIGNNLVGLYYENNLSDNDGNEIITNYPAVSGNFTDNERLLVDTYGIALDATVFDLGVRLPDDLADVQIGSFDALDSFTNSYCQEEAKTLQK